MCTAEITEYASPTLKGTYVNVTQATGKNGAGLENVKALTIADNGTVASATNGFNVGITATFKDKDDNPIAAPTGQMTLPIKGANGVSVGVNGTNNAIEVKMDPNGFQMASNQFYNVKKADGATLLQIDGRGYVNINPNNNTNAAIGLNGKIPDSAKKPHFNDTLAIIGQHTSLAGITQQFLPTQFQMYQRQLNKEHCLMMQDLPI